MTSTQDKRRHTLLREIAMYGVACRSAEHKRCGNRPDDEARAESVARARYDSAQSMIDELLAESTARLSRAESADHAINGYVADREALWRVVKESCAVLRVTDDDENDWPKLTRTVELLTAERDEARKERDALRADRGRWSTVGGNAAAQARTLAAERDALAAELREIADLLPGDGPLVERVRAMVAERVIVEPFDPFALYDQDNEDRENQVINDEGRLIASPWHSPEPGCRRRDFYDDLAGAVTEEGWKAYPKMGCYRDEGMSGAETGEEGEKMVDAALRAWGIDIDKTGVWWFDRCKDGEP